MRQSIQLAKPPSNYLCQHLCVFIGSHPHHDPHIRPFGHVHFIILLRQPKYANLGRFALAITIWDCSILSALSCFSLL